MVSPLNPSDLDRFRREQEAWKMRRERGMARAIYRALTGVAREAALAYEQGLDPLAGPLATDGLPVALESILNERLLTAAVAWGRQIENSAKSFTDFQRKDFATSLLEYLRTFLAAYTATKVTQISETTRAQIRQSIEVGLQQQLGSRAIARLIRQRSRKFDRARALTIARTEISAVTNAASEFSADALGIQYQKKWIAASDARTRPSHQAANGQVRDREDAFDVGGAKLMRPGDPNGPAREIVNCRCQVVLLRK